MRSTTHESYRHMVVDHLIPHLGKVELRHLSARHFRKLQNLLDHGRSDGKGGLSRRTVQHVQVVARHALGDAVTAGLLMRNPLQGVKRVRV